MKKLSTKLVAILLALMMVMTSAPFSAIAATTAPKSKLTALSDQITDYRDNYMNGQKLYTNMAAAYTSYINAVKVYDKAKYGADDVTQADIEAATSDLAAKCTAMTEWVPKTGTQRPSSSTKGFSADSNTNTSVNNATTTYANGWRPFADNTGNKYVDDIYSSTYMNLGYFQSNVSSTSATWGVENCQFGIYIPNAVIIYDGSDNFKARVGVMAHYKSGTANNKKRKVAQIMVNGNDYLHFGDNWLQNAKSDGDTNFNVTSRYEQLDFVGAIGRPSPTDRASGNSTPDTNGTRVSSGGWFSQGDQYYLGNYIEFTVPASASAFNTNTAASYAITSLPVQSKSGDTTFNDTWNGNVTVSIQVLNYSLLIKKMNAVKTSLRITESNPYLEGGLSALITALNNAMNWNPNGQSNISTLTTNMNSYITAINNATVTADNSPYGLLAAKLADVLDTENHMGEWYNVNNKTDNYTDESIDAFVKAFTYAQGVFDANVNFADSYSFAAESVTVGSGDTAKTVNVPAATKTVQQVYDDLMAAGLVASQRVDASELIMLIEESKVALANARVFGIAGSQTEIDFEGAVEDAKYYIWGETTYTYTDEDTGETISRTVSNYPDPGSLPKDTSANRNKVQTWVNNLKPYINALVVNRNQTVVYNEASGEQGSLGRVISDMLDTNLYPRGDYVNADTLDEAVNYVNNNFVAAVIPNQNTQIVAGIVQDKVDEYKYYIQYCYDVIAALEKTFLALDNGTIIQQGDMETLTPKQNEDKWSLTFARYNNPVVFRTTKLQATLGLGSGSLSFWQGDCTALGNEAAYNAVLDSISLDDQAGGSNNIRKENAISFNALPPVTLSEDECAQYPGKLSVSTTNGGTYGIMGIVGIRGKDDGQGGYVFGKGGSDGSLTSGLAVTEGTMGAATGVYAFDDITTLVAGTMYLSLPAEPSVTLTRTTVPKSTTYSFTGYFGHVFYWTSDGAGVSIVKNVYNGYYHERTENTYTQNSTVVDISNLKELVTNMNTLNKSDYTEASWNQMKAKLAAATSNDFGNGKSYRDLTTANLVSNLTTRYQQLYDAWKGLIPAATNIELTRPVAQAQNEGKNIGAVVRANDNLLYTKRQTNNDVTAENTYGTYTTNTWNDFQAAYDAGDVAIFGDGTNAGQYATPTFDTDGNSVVVGTRAYARFKNSDGDPLDISDLDALGLTINDMEAIEQAQGVSLSDAQAAINQMAANIRTKYAALKRWANFAPVDSAMDALSNTFQSNYDRVYTTDSLKAINTAFAAAPISTNKFYQIANDDAAQHALVNGVAKYDEDDDTAIAAEATAITGTLPPTASTMDQGYYTAASIIAMAEGAASDPDAYDADEAVALATTLAGQLFETVNIAPLNNKAVEGVNFVDNDAIDAALADIMTHVSTISYDVVVKNEKGETLATYEDQPYGTELTINSTSGNPVEWTYTYESRTVKNHTPSRIGSRAALDIVVVGDTTITEGEYYGEGSAATGYKVVFNDNLNHVYDVEYVQAGATITYGENSIIVTDGAKTKEIAPPSYAFYNFTSFKNASSSPVSVSADMVVTAQYEADEDYEEAFEVTIINIDRNAAVSQFYVPYNTKFTIDPELIVDTSNTKPGSIYVNGEKTTLTRRSGITPGNELYCMTYAENSVDYYYDDWREARDSYDDAAMGSEIPFTANSKGEYNFYVGSNTVIVLYENEETYETATIEGFVSNGPTTYVNESVVLSNNKFTMNGKLYLPDGNSLVECGILMYIGNQEIAADDLTLTTYKNLSGAYRLKYTKSTEYGNINVSFLRKAADGTPYFSGATRVRYRTFVTYKDSSNGIHTIYSSLADDTQNM